MAKIAKKYVLSFTAGGLLYHESVTVAEAYQICKDWKRTSEIVEAQNLLQSRTASTTKRKLREVRQRLQGLTEDQLDLLASGSRTEQRWLLWLACCRCYQLLADFAKDVLRGKFLELDISIHPVDIENFFESKLVWHEELEELTVNTKAKLQTVLMRMLREAELLSDDGIIQSPIMSQQLVDVLRRDSVDNFHFYPMTAPE